MFKTGCIEKIYSVSALVGSNKCNANCEWKGSPTLTQAMGCQPK